MRILHVVGARPNFVKMAPVIREAAGRPGLENIVVHTGQHYDEKMSTEMLEDLEFPRPDHFLEVGSGRHGEMTARALERIETLMLECRPDHVVVAGDVNSTLAAALAASKLGIAISHVEAGLRSRDWAMPEEINRVLTDRLSDLLFTHSPEAEPNLVAEGIDPARVHLVGNTMIDSLRRFEERAAAREAWRPHGVEEGGFVLVTLHRPSNVDDPGSLSAIVDALVRLGETAPVLFPVHPRTRARLAVAGRLDDLTDRGVRCLEPVGYLDFLSLEMAAGAIATDSGGIQEEAAAFGVPCFTLRANTERPVTISHGTNVLLGDDPRALEQVRLRTGPREPCAIPLWDGQAAARLVDHIVEHAA